MIGSMFWVCCPICGNQSYLDWGCEENGLSILDVDGYLVDGEWEDVVSEIECCNCGYSDTDMGMFEELWLEKGE